MVHQDRQQPDAHRDASPKKHSRRHVIASVVTGIGVSVAGCINGGGGDPSDARTSFECGDSRNDKEAVNDLPQPTLGSADATVTVDIFEDYSCPHCADFTQNTLPKLTENYLGEDTDTDVQFKYFDYPVPMSGWTRPIANAARAVQHEQGDEAFWEFNKAIYDSQGNYAWERVGETAETVGVDPCIPIRDGYNKRFTPIIEANRKTGEERGIDGTPAIFVNQELVIPEESWFTAVDQKIESQM